MDSDKVLDRAFNLYIQGYSLRNLEKRFHIPKSTLSFKFRKKYGEGYSSLKNSQGVMSIIKEYLRSPNLGQSDKNSIQKWMYTNLSSIMESDIKNHQVPLLSDKQLDNLTREQCSSRGGKDWKTLFELTLAA